MYGYYSYELITSPDPDGITISDDDGTLDIVLNSQGPNRGAISKTIQVKMSFYGLDYTITSNPIPI